MADARCGAVAPSEVRSPVPHPCVQKRGKFSDFRLYSSGILERGLEVTRVFPPDYKAHKHHREMEEAGPRGPQSHPQDYPAYAEHWNWLRAAVKEKLAKPYIASCDLLVYFDVSIGDTVEPSMDFGLSIRDEWLRCLDRDFGIPEIGNSGVHNIIILSSGLDSLAIIYPEFIML